MFKKILIADDHSIVRIGIAAAFEAYDKEVQIYFAESSFEAEEILGEKNADLLIMDIQMPGVDHSVIRRIRAIDPSVKVLLFSGFKGEMLHHFIHEGVDGYLSKQASYKQILDGVKTLYDTGSVFPPDIIREYLFPEREDPRKILSEREYEVFTLLIQGFGNLEITNALSIQPGTVSTYKKRIFTKLKVNSIPDLVKMQIEFNS